MAAISSPLPRHSISSTLRYPGKSSSPLLHFCTCPPTCTSRDPETLSITSPPEVAVDPPKPPSDQATLLADAFAKPGRSSDEIKLDLDSKSVVVTLDLVLRVLKDPDTDTDVAKRVLNWALENELFASASKNNNTSKGSDLENICSSISMTVRGESWGDDVEKKLRELNVEFSSDLVADVLENLELEPNKALIFFRWVEESHLFKHDERSYNAIARVLSKEDESEKFWKIVDEMRSAGHEMERETYIDIFDRFVEWKMIKDALGLCEFGATQKRLLQDMDLFLQVLRVVKAKVNDGSDSVIKPLASVGILKECNRILLAMEEVDIPDLGTWVSLIKGHCAEGNMDEACTCFEEMLEKEGPHGECNAGHALDWLIATYCRENRPADAYRFIYEMYLRRKWLKPWNSTYKQLTRKLLAKKHFDKALRVMGNMSNKNSPPDLDSFFEYLSNTGSAEEAAEFVQELTKEIPYCYCYILDPRFKMAEEPTYCLLGMFCHSHLFNKSGEEFTTSYFIGL